MKKKLFEPEYEWEIVFDDRYEGEKCLYNEYVYLIEESLLELCYFYHNILAQKEKKKKKTKIEEK